MVIYCRHHTGTHLKETKNFHTLTTERRTATATGLGTAPVPRLMLALALPQVAAQAVQVAYNIVDRIYIGHIAGGEGMASLTGVGVTLPVLLIASAFAMLCGMGGAPLAAIELGRAEHDKTATDRAAKILGNAAVMLVFFALIITVAFRIFARPLLQAFGASERTMPYALRYFNVYILGTLFMSLSTGLSPFISAQGRAKTAMAATLLGALLNMALDPIFIFTLGRGAQGAAEATVLSQAASCAFALCFLLSKRSAIPLARESYMPSMKVIWKITSLGISPFVMQVTESAVGATLNTGLRQYGGDNYVAAMTVLQSLMQMCFVPIIGWTHGSAPVVSYNYGAQKIDRARQAAILMVSAASIVSAAAFAITSLNARFFVSMFTNQAALLDLAAGKLPLYFGAMWLFGLQLGAQSVFMALGKARTSLFIACLRKVILLIPLAIILPRFLGVAGIFMSEPIASATSALTSGAMLMVCMRRELRIR